jgi:hypothetical protein
MGTIYFNPDKHLSYYDEVNRIETQNWRSIKLDEKEKGLSIILPGCMKVFVPNFGIEDFHKINHHNKTIKKSFTFVNISLSCIFCRGYGFVYWIDNMTNNPVKSLPTETYSPLSEKFKRNPNGEIIVIGNTYLKYPYYNSTPYVTEQGQVICKRCYGSGLHIHEDLKFKERIYIKNC